METICYHHNDLDGITAGALVLRAYPDAEMVSVSYNDSWRAADIAGKRVFVVDFSFPNMIELQAACAELIWCDHHKTARDSQKKAWNSPEIAGCRSFEYAGCMLTYAFLNKIELKDINALIEQHDVPAVVRYVGIYDMWKHTSGDVVDAFCATAFVKLTAPDSQDFDYLLAGITECEIDYVRTGEVLIEAAINRVKRIADREAPIKLKTSIGNVTMLVVNATTDVSRMGDYINSVLGCDIAVMYEVTGDNFDCKVSLRSKTCTIDTIATVFGGGGHPHAAGFVTDLTPSKLRDDLCGLIYRACSTLNKKV